MINNVDELGKTIGELFYLRKIDLSFTYIYLLTYY